MSRPSEIIGLRPLAPLVSLARETPILEHSRPRSIYHLSGEGYSQRALRRGFKDCRSPGTWEFLAEVFRNFDLLAVQEIMDDLSGLRWLPVMLASSAMRTHIYFATAMQSTSWTAADCWMPCRSNWASVTSTPPVFTCAYQMEA